MFLVKTRDVPLEQCRGIETIDWNEDLVLVRAQIEQVAQAFTQVRQANLWERDVYEREIEIIGQDFIVFRLRGHSWTLVHGKRILRSRMPLNDEDAQALSHLLHTRAIYFRNSDTGGSIEYHLYDCGESTEKLYFSYDLLVGEMDEEEKNLDDLDDEEYQLLLDEEMECDSLSA